jgi:hypothetical protein
VKVAVIVEGHGEEAAAPVLLRRLASWLAPDVVVEATPTIRLPRGKMVKEPELGRAIELAARKAGRPAAPILVLLDADQDAACVLGPRLLRWARAVRADREIAVVVAVREYEAWLMAGAASLAG